MLINRETLVVEGVCICEADMLTHAVFVFVWSSVTVCLNIATHSPTKSLRKGSESYTSVEISSAKSWLISCRSFTLSLCATALIL